VAEAVLRNDRSSVNNLAKSLRTSHNEKPHAALLLFLSENFVNDQVVVIVIGDERDTVVPYLGVVFGSLQAFGDVDAEAIEDLGNGASRKQV